MQNCKSKLHYSPEAINDLDEIWAYILDELQNPESAASTVDGILDHVAQLQQFPQMGPVLSAITEIESDYRFLICGGYLAIYHIADADVYVDRVLYGKRDYVRILLEEATESTVY